MAAGPTKNKPLWVLPGERWGAPKDRWLGAVLGVSSEGRVFTKGALLEPEIDQDGHLVVTVAKKRYKVAWLVWQTFGEGGQFVHIDGDFANCRLDNLRGKARKNTPESPEHR